MTGQSSLHSPPHRFARNRRAPVAIPAAGAAILLMLGGCSSSASTGSAPAPTAPPGSTVCSYLPSQRPAAKEVSLPPAVEPATGTTPATIALTGDEVVIELDTATTPCTVGSFVHLAQSGYFDDTPCHRLTADPSLSVLQCGDPSGTGGGGPGYTFPDETNPEMRYPAGTVAMANAGPDTNGSQFFLVYQDSTLPPDYTVFGTITAGIDVLQRHCGAGHHRIGQRHRPGPAGHHLLGHRRRLTGPWVPEPATTEHTARLPSADRPHRPVRYDHRTTSSHSSRGAEGHGPTKPRQPLSMITLLVTAFRPSEADRQ